MNKLPIPSTEFLDTNRSHWLYSHSANLGIDLTVTLGYLSSKIALRPLRRSRKVTLQPSDIVPGKKYIFASNHQSVLDPFLITGQIPNDIWPKLGSLRYFLANKFFDRPWLRPFAVALGSFPATAHKRYPFGLAFAIQQLNNGRSIHICPEGRRTIRGEYRIRHGVEVLAKEPEAMIVPIHLEWDRSTWPRKFEISYGRPFDGSRMTAEEIMERIYALPLN